MRRVDLINVGRSISHKSLNDDTVLTLSFELVLTSYLTFVSFCLEKNFDPLRCLPDPRKHVIELVLCVFVPTLLARLILFFSLRRKSFAKMRSRIMTLNLTWGIAYGAWTMIQVCEIFYHPRLRDCKYNNHSLLELNYVVILLCGVFISLNLVCLLIYTLTTCQSICAADGDS